MATRVLKKKNVSDLIVRQRPFNLKSSLIVSTLIPGIKPSLALSFHSSPVGVNISVLFFFPPQESDKGWFSLPEKKKKPIQHWVSTWGWILAEGCLVTVLDGYINQLNVLTSNDMCDASLSLPPACSYHYWTFASPFQYGLEQETTRELRI